MPGIVARLGGIGALLALVAVAWAGPGFDEELLIRDLQREHVVVAREMRIHVGPADDAALERFATAGTPHLKMVVLDQEPPAGRAVFALRLHKHLGLGDTALIVVTPSGLAAHSEAISTARMQQITDAAARRFAVSWREGLEETGRRIRDAVAAKQQRGVAAFLAVAILVALLVVGLMARRRNELERTLGEARRRAADLAQRLQDAEIDARLSKDPRAGECYSQASQRFVDASAILERDTRDLGEARRANALLREAEELLEGAPDAPQEG
jgi:hypothetical protein